MNLYIPPLIAFLVCLVLTPLVRHVAIRKGWMAQPTQERWHKKPTALLGGIAIYAGLSIPLLIIADFKSLWPHVFIKAGPAALPSIGATIWLGSTFLFVLGLLDDFLDIKPQTKLVGQIFVAAIAAFLGFRLHWFVSLTGDTMVTIFWIVGITNSFNLIDNMDGLCSGIGLIAAGVAAVLFFGVFDEAALVGLILAGALGAFLIYNFNPAKIFMGDSGSLVIGYSLAVLSLYYSEMHAANVLSVYFVPVFLLLVPIFDTTLVTFIRILSGRKASTGGKDHTSHRLVLMGLNEKSAVVFLYGIGLLSGLSAIFVSRVDTLTSPVVIMPAVVTILLMGIYLAQLRVYPEREFSRLRDKSYTPILIEITYKRQILLVLLDLCLMAFAYYLSYRLRFGHESFGKYFDVFLRSLPAIIACKFCAFYWIGIYNMLWRYISVNDVYVCIKASIVASILCISIVTFIYRFQDFSKGIFLIDWLLTTGFLLGTRWSFKLFIDTIKRRTLSGVKVIIYGAGSGGELLLREILNNNRLQLNPVGFVDDDLKKLGKRIQGYPVLGALDDLKDLKAKYQIAGVLISFFPEDDHIISRTARLCTAHKLFLKRFSIKLDNVSEP